MSELLTVVLASTNPGKLAELRSLLAGLPVQLVSFRDVTGETQKLAEDGDTFAANAAQKAKTVCQMTQLIALADDSGLEVLALGGRPGVRSARFAHERATDAENNAALLREMQEIDDDQRQAQFRCILSLVTPWEPDLVHSVEGSCQGRIARTPRGSAGFGYDPLFLLDECAGRSMAELDDAEKNTLSHRARAVRALRPLLMDLIDRQLAEAERICRSAC